MPGYSPEVAEIIKFFASEDTSFREAAMAYDRHLSNTMELWSATNKARGEHSRTEAENAALFSSGVGDVLKGIMLLRWPVAAAEWFKGV